MHIELGGDSLHLESYQVVGEEQPPHLLGYGGRRLAADRLKPLEHVGLELAKTELDLPTLVIERPDLVGWVRCLVE